MLSKIFGFGRELILGMMYGLHFTVIYIVILNIHDVLLLSIGLQGKTVEIATSLTKIMILGVTFIATISIFTDFYS